MAANGKSAETALPLREISRMVQQWIGRLGDVWVTGQLVEIKQRGGWYYMVLRDSGVQMSMDLSCSQMVYQLGGEPRDGATVIAHVRVSYYEKNGRLSLQASELQVTGEGRLLAQLDQRRRMLQAEGLFDAVRKKRLPRLPRAIGLVTAENSAAERDVVVTVAQRWPAARLEIRHVRVQGQHAAGEVMAALAELDAHPDVDVVVIARGGGSMEDLLPFSDEGLVRAVAAARTPVVSAIGHETDTPIVDFAADLRAATPTAAAKAVTLDMREELAATHADLERVRRAVERRLQREQEWLDRERKAPVLRDPTATVALHEERLAELRRRADRAIDARLHHEATTVAAQRSRVVAMSPKATLQRGYAILTRDGSSVASVTDATVGDSVHAYLADGTLDLTVTATHQEES